MSRPAALRHTISIPPSLLISALGQVDDVRDCVTMDLKQAGNHLYLVGSTANELGGSHFAMIHGLDGGQVPRVDPGKAAMTFAAMHQAIKTGLIRACHDLSEGGLATAVAEMAFAGGLGATLNLAAVPNDLPGNLTEFDATLLFSESNTRFVCEVAAEHAARFETVLADVPHARIGSVADTRRLNAFSARDATLALIAESVDELKEAWLAPLNW